MSRRFASFLTIVALAVGVLIMADSPALAQRGGYGGVSSVGVNSGGVRNASSVGFNGGGFRNDFRGGYYGGGFFPGYYGGGFPGFYDYRLGLGFYPYGYRPYP
jgi:hypothetical protein